MITLRHLLRHRYIAACFDVETRRLRSITRLIRLPVANAIPRRF